MCLQLTYETHISGILTHHVSDHFMSFCIVEGKIKRTRDTPKYIEVENITLLSILSYKTVTMTLFCTHGRVSGPSSLLDLEVMAPRGYSVPCQF